MSSGLLKSFASVAVALGLLGCCLVPSLPMFLADRQRQKQSECRKALRVVLQRFTERGDGGVTLAELAAAVPAARRQPYTYVLGEGHTVPPLRDPPPEAERQRQLAQVKLLVDPGLRGTCPDCQLTIACVGNTDDDEGLDLVSVSSVTRYAYGNLPLPAGETDLQQSDYSSDPGKALRFEATDGG